MKRPLPVIEIDPLAGFCSGVNRAIGNAGKHLSGGERLKCLGELVHNEEELDRLRSLGMDFISQEDISPDLRKVFIRAHGEPPVTYNKLKALKLEIVDATCPVVSRLQQKVGNSSREFKRMGEGQVVIFGKPGHPEVIGLMGNTSGNAVVVQQSGDFGKIAFGGPLHLFAQTTANQDDYRDFCEAIKQRTIEAGGDIALVTVTNSICGQVSRRAPSLLGFARSHDVIVFVSGQESSNGKYLAGLSRTVNANTYTVSSPGEIQDWFGNAGSIGISGATSTPRWLLEQVADKIMEITGNL